MTKAARKLRSAASNATNDDIDAAGPLNDRPESSKGKQRMPRLICFDLDYTLWPLWVDTHVSPPIKRRKDDDDNKVFDKYGDQMSFYPDVPDILSQLKHDKDVHVAVASRTSAPKAAEQALDQLLIRDTANEKASQELIKSISCFNTREIYPGSKLKHFKEIHRKTGIPYDEMVFYDDESRNREVASLGVTFVLVPEGVNRRIFEHGLADWRRAGGHAANDKVFVERRASTELKLDAEEEED